MIDKDTNLLELQEKVGNLMLAVAAKQSVNRKDDFNAHERAKRLEEKYGFLDGIYDKLNNQEVLMEEELLSLNSIEEKLNGAPKATDNITNSVCPSSKTPQLFAAALIIIALIITLRFVVFQF